MAPAISISVELLGAVQWEVVWSVVAWDHASGVCGSGSDVVECGRVADSVVVVIRVSVVSCSIGVGVVPLGSVVVERICVVGVSVAVNVCVDIVRDSV